MNQRVKAEKNPPGSRVSPRPAAVDRFRVEFFMGAFFCSAKKPGYPL
jgi:hypothetical protein